MARPTAPSSSLISTSCSGADPSAISRQSSLSSFHARFEQGELVGPGGEAAGAAVVVQLGQNGHQRVVGALLGEVLAVGRRPRGGAAVHLEVGGAQQQLVQPLHGPVVFGPGRPQPIQPAL
jgi:hypothetical protein